MLILPIPLAFRVREPPTQRIAGARSLQGMSGHVLCQQSTTCIWNPCWKLAHKCPRISCMLGWWPVALKSLPPATLENKSRALFAAHRSDADPSGVSGESNTSPVFQHSSKILTHAAPRKQWGAVLTKHSILPILHRHLRRHLGAKGRIVLCF